MGAVMVKRICTAVKDTALAAIISVKVVLSAVLKWIAYGRVKMVHVRGNGPNRITMIEKGVN